MVNVVQYNVTVYGCGLRDLVPLVGIFQFFMLVRVYAGGPRAVVFSSWLFLGGVVCWFLVWGCIWSVGGNFWLLCHGSAAAGRVVFFRGCVGVCHHGEWGACSPPVVCCSCDSRVGVGYPQVPCSNFRGSCFCVRRVLYLWISVAVC